MDTSNKSDKGLWLTNKTFLAIFGALFALLFITLMIVISVATQVEDLDEKLKYIPPQTKAAEIPSKAMVAGQMVYVPVYSHIYAKGGKPFLLEATLSVRNSDPKENIRPALKARPICWGISAWNMILWVNASCPKMPIMAYRPCGPWKTLPYPAFS